MKRIITVILLITSRLIIASACTTFFINKDGQLIFGRNYDWITDAGSVCTNLRGLYKTSLKTAGGRTINWVSKYGSITFNQYGKEFPTGGMNEKGLVVELMWLDGTKYPAEDDRPAIGVLQWIQYQLDNCASIDEVIASDKNVRISYVNTSPLHYLVADANGKAATIEFLEGKMVVHRDKNLLFPVLTNNRYDESLAAHKTSATTGQNSLERFSKACQMIERLNSNVIPNSLVDYSFDILNSVSQGDFTKWSIVYDIGNKTIHFRTHRFQEIKTITFGAFDLSCASTGKMWDLNQKGNGSINQSLQDFDAVLNRNVIETACMESASQISISKTTQDLLAQYPATVKCK